MKKGRLEISTIAKIILILIVLFFVTISISGLYGQTFEEGIKKLLGEKTDSEITHKQNIQAKTNFENLIKQIKECRDSKGDNCGCSVNLNNFKENYRIIFTNEEIKLMSIKNLKDKGIQVDSSNLGLNCYWSKSFEKEDLTEIFFEDEQPIIFEEIPVWTSTTGRGWRYKFTYDFNLLKRDGKLCWLTNKVREYTIKDIKDCSSKEKSKINEPEPYVSLEGIEPTRLP